MARLGVAFLTWRRYLQRRYQQFGITIKQLRILEELHKSGKLSPSRIADILFADRPTTTVVINNLEKNGWITKKKDETNRKRTLVSLTASGEEKRREVRAGLSEGEIVFNPESCFDEEEKRRFHALLDSLEEHFRAIRE
jgi:DNA-binding MarR family transcriptional regulator